MSDQKKNESSSNSDQKDNVIRFPVEKVRQKNRLKRLAGKMGDNKKSTLFLSLLSVLFISVYILKSTQENSRYIASSIDNRDPVKEAELNDTLQDERRRNPASFGRKPTGEERLREQELNRGYQFKYNGVDGLVVEVAYIRGEDGSEMFEPVYIKDLRSFLLRNRETITPGYDEVKADGSTFILIKNGTPVGNAHFQFDEMGKLLSLKVQVF